MLDPIHITPAQAKVAHLVGAGLTNPEIARTLGIAGMTVKNHLNAIYGQGGVVTRNELIRACHTETLGIRHL
jgi:DNA-binding CsgD family transcriptional regulator